MQRWLSSQQCFRTNFGKLCCNKYFEGTQFARDISLITCFSILPSTVCIQSEMSNKLMERSNDKHLHYG